jgi:hypothetical protein
MHRARLPFRSVGFRDVRMRFGEAQLLRLVQQLQLRSARRLRGAARYGGGQPNPEP